MQAPAIHRELHIAYNRASRILFMQVEDEMRRPIGFLIAILMTFGSFYIFYSGFVEGRGIGPGLYFAAALFGFVGIGWLWVDYISSWLGFGNSEF